FKEYYYGWEELQDTVNQLIPYKLQQMQEWLSWESSQTNSPPATTQPYLCEICPQQEKCRSYFEGTGNREQGTGKGVGSREWGLGEDVINNQEEENQVVEGIGNREWGTGKEVNYSSLNQPSLVNNQEDNQICKEIENGEQGIVDADAVGQELVATLQSFGIRVNFVGAAVAPSFIRVKLKPQPGVKYTSIQKLYADLQIQMELENPPLIEPQAGYVSVDLPHPNRKAAFFDDYLKPQTIQESASVKVAIGVNLEGKLIEADLSDPNTCHFLVGGTTGSGKSEFLRSQLLSLLIRYSPEQLKIALVDPKRVTFPEFEKMSWLYSSVVKDSEGAIELMDKLVDEMEFRYQRFEKIGCADLGTYNQRSDQPLPRIICIFDEYADFMAEKESRSALEQSIKRLGAMARAAGIHLIIATQRPEAKVVTPIIRSNLPGRVALRTASEADSM
ncbi:MAG: DNA translocase FtsK, partial [Cyanobacteria bacterium J06629_18]